MNSTLLAPFTACCLAAAPIFALHSSQRAPLTVAAADDTPLVPHSALADEFLRKHGLDPAVDASTVVFADVLKDHFFHARLGVLDLAIDARLLADKAVAADMLKLVQATTRLQAHWVSQTGGESDAAKQAQKDAAELVAWVGGLRGDAFAAATNGKPGDFLTALAPPQKVAEAAARFTHHIASGAAVGLEREGSPYETLLIAPKRRDFHVLLGLFGWLSPDLQEVYWHDGTIPWTNTYYNEYTVVALQYHTGDDAAGSIYAGIDNNERNPTAMEQQVVQLAANAMITNLYGDRIAPALVGAMAINLVIDLFGECATRVDGDLRERRTEAREVFIPGGQSQGGMLPPNFANSRFRGEEGKDRFVVPLKSCQSAGATQAKQERLKGKIEHFQLWNDSQGKRFLVSAPLIGTPAAAQPELPENFHGDGAEFFRAYRTCFWYWLETQGGGSQKKSEELYADLLIELAALESAADLEAAIQRVYSRALSAEVPGKEDLEGRFLAWLAKQ